MRRFAPSKHRWLLPATLLAASLGCSDAGESRSKAAGGGSADPAVPLAPPVERADLMLTVKVGDRFPLRKVVEQVLVQSASGSLTEPTETRRSRLEMLLAITVEAERRGETRFGVRYDRVRFTRTDGGESIEYDSARPPVALPLELAAYQGMVGRGFSFWLGAQRRIVRVEGFAAFLKDVLEDVPPESRGDVLLGVESGTGGDGVTDFIDDTLGLLPFDGAKAAGDTWRHTRRIARPVPMHIDTVCTLRDLTAALAVVDVRGAVTPLVSSGVQTASHQSLHVIVERGSTVGECTLFRDTGLPKESRIVQEVELAISVPGQPAIRQRQRVTTTIESYPAAGSAERGAGTPE